MKREVNKDVKVMWLSRMFYGVSHAFDFDINPHNDLSQFLDAKLNTLRWGENKQEAKERFSRKYHLLLDLYSIKLPLKYILAELNEENQLIKAIAERWAEHSEFPANW
jgi:hypothetical protein